MLIKIADKIPVYVFCRGMEPFIKDVRSQEGRGVCPVRIFLGQGAEGILQMRTSELFGAKYFVFFEIYDVSARAARERGGGRRGGRGGEGGGGGGQFFAILCGRLLWTIYKFAKNL